MKMDSFFQVIFYICICIVIFTLAINVINALNLFQPVASGYSLQGKTADQIFTDITGLSGGLQYIWLAILSSTGLAAMLLVKITQSPAIIAVWLFSEVFWTSYTRVIDTVNINGWIPAYWMTLFTVALLFLWVGAIIGMLSGN